MVFNEQAFVTTKINMAVGLFILLGKLQKYEVREMLDSTPVSKSYDSIIVSMSLFFLRRTLHLIAIGSNFLQL